MDPPPVGLFTRYVLENPYPLGLVLLALAVGVLWTALRGGQRERLTIAGVLGALGAAVLIAGVVVVTSGEQARRVTREVVEAAVAGDVGRASAQFTDDAMLAFGSQSNPGFARDAIETRLNNLAGRYAIASNQITSLKGYPLASDRGTAHLAVRTTLEMGVGPVPTQWVLDVERQPDGTWKIVRATWVSIMGRTPGSELGR